MTRFYERWLLVLAIGLSGTCAADLSLNRETSDIPAPPPDIRCRLTVSPPVVDYGVMSRWQLEETSYGVSPGTRSLRVSVVCPFPQVMTLRVEGEGNEACGIRYGERGCLRLRLLDAQLDGNAVVLRHVTPDGRMKESESHRPALYRGQALTPVSQGLPVEGRALTATLDIQPLLMEADVRVSNQQRSETTLTLTVDN